MKPTSRSKLSEGQLLLLDQVIEQEEAYLRGERELSQLRAERKRAIHEAAQGNCSAQQIGEVINRSRQRVLEIVAEMKTEAEIVGSSQ